MFEQVGEKIGTIMFSNPNLDKLRQEVLMALASFEESGKGLDSKSLEEHLIKTLDFRVSWVMLCAGRYNNHASFSRTEEDSGSCEDGMGTAV